MNTSAAQLAQPTADQRADAGIVLPDTARIRAESEARCASYARLTGFPRSLFVAEDGRIVGTWIMGQDYRADAAYYGAYPAGYLRRVAAMFPEKSRVLHLFSGRVRGDALRGDAVDVNPELGPTYCANCETLEGVPLARYDLILADPPYSAEDAEHYGAAMVNRNRVVAQLGRRCRRGAHLVWLDQVLPMYRKDQWRLAGAIGMLKSTNHRFRIVSIFEARS